MVEKDDSGGQMRTGEGDRFGMMLVWAKRWMPGEELMNHECSQWPGNATVKVGNLWTTRTRSPTRSPGWHLAAIRRRYPATAPRGDFCLLGFPPQPVRPSLGDLDSPTSDRPSIIGAVLSVDTRSTCTSKHQFSRSREIPHPGLQVARLQAHPNYYYSYCLRLSHILLLPPLILLPLLLLPLQLQLYHNINNTNKLNLIKYNRSNQTQTSLQQTP